MLNLRGLAPLPEDKIPGGFTFITRTDDEGNLTDVSISIPGYEYYRQEAQENLFPISSSILPFIKLKLIYITIINIAE